MLDCYQAFGDPHWLAVAHECASQLQRFRVVDRPGVYTMHNKQAVSPDLMLGYGGAGSFLLRLSRAESASDLLFGPLNAAIKQVAAGDGENGSSAAASMYSRGSSISAGRSDRPDLNRPRKERSDVGEIAAEGSRPNKHG
jgi:hypothetical protein